MHDALLLLLFALPSLTWLYTLAVVPWQARKLVAIGQLPLPVGPLPRLTIVIAARNEAVKIEAALKSLLNETYTGMEVVVVNDRSTDMTGKILDRMMISHERLRVIHVAALPPGWLGKNHALQKGLDAATGEFVLFTDADVHFSQGTLQRVVAHMKRNALDHVASAPRLVNHEASMRVMLPAFSVFFLQITQPWKAADPNSIRHIGIGAFNLVRRDALLALNGFERIRLRPDDDLMLAKLLKTTGHRADFLLSDGHIRVEWYRTATETIRGLEKNAFAHFDYRPVVTTLAMLATLCLVFMPLAGTFLLPTLAGWFSLAGSVAMLLFAILTTRMIHLASGWGLLFPIGTLLVVYATLRSMSVTLKQHGIVWRDTFYSLRELRSNRP